MDQPITETARALLRAQTERFRAEQDASVAYLNMQQAISDFANDQGDAGHVMATLVAYRGAYRVQQACQRQCSQLWAQVKEEARTCA